MFPATAVKTTHSSLVSTQPYGDCQDLEFILKNIFWSFLLKHKKELLEKGTGSSF